MLNLSETREKRSQASWQILKQEDCRKQYFERTAKKTNGWNIPQGCGQNGSDDKRMKLTEKQNPSSCYPVHYLKFSIVTSSHLIIKYQVQAI